MRDVSIISARRSYEFPQDGIRLTLLSTQPVVAFIKDAFSFEFAAVATPMETFGPIPNTLPPGVVFNYGIAPSPEESGTPIRFLHIEQRRHQSSIIICIPKVILRVAVCRAWREVLRLKIKCGTDF